MKSLVLTLAAVSIMLGATSASAIEFHVLGATEATVLVGELVTIEIVMTNNSLTPMFGLWASVSDYGANEFASGQAVPSYLNTDCFGPGLCFGGIDNMAGGALAESALGGEANRVQIASSACVACPVVGAAGVDQGLDMTPGSAMFELTFIARESALINIGTSYLNDGVILGSGYAVQAQGATFGLKIIPEPGTALLLGLGLAGLSTRRLPGVSPKG